MSGSTIPEFPLSPPSSIDPPPITQVLPSDDPFDEQNFDATKIINGYFPSEQSLNSAEAVADSLAAQMTKANHLILQAVEHQSSAGEEAKQDLEHADASVSRLTEGLARIGAKSRRTEATIRSICGDIQALDWAKQNLTQVGFDHCDIQSRLIHELWSARLIHELTYGRRGSYVNSYIVDKIQVFGFRVLCRKNIARVGHNLLFARL